MTLAIGFLLILHNQLYAEDSSGTGEPSRPEGIFAVCGHTTHCYTEAWEINPSLQDDSVQLHFYLTKPLLPFRSREQRLAEMVISATADHITDSPLYTSTLSTFKAQAENFFKGWWLYCLKGRVEATASGSEHKPESLLSTPFPHCISLGNIREIELSPGCYQWDLLCVRSAQNTTQNHSGHLSLGPHLYPSYRKYHQGRTENLLHFSSHLLHEKLYFEKLSFLWIIFANHNYFRKNIKIL